jgi:hypothetical protein
MPDVLEYGPPPPRNYRWMALIAGPSAGLFALLLFKLLVHTPHPVAVSTLAPQFAAAPAVLKFHVIPFAVDPNTGLMVVSGRININAAYPQVQPPIKQLVIDTDAPHTCFFAGEDEIAMLMEVISGAKMDEWKESDGRTVKVCRFDLGRITVGNISIDTPVYIRESDMDAKPSYDGLLGMDFLSRFKVQIDFQAKTLTLTEK